jgi:hypothetical protein
MRKLVITWLPAVPVCLLLIPAALAQPRFPSADELQRMHRQQAAPDKPTPAPVTPRAPQVPNSAGASATWGAIGFTADGSFSTAWKASSKAEAEADVAKRCAKFGRGACEVVGFPGNLCAALATYAGAHSGRRYRLSFTGGGVTSPEAQKAALDRCNEDRRTRRRCQLRTVVCGDGR